MSGIKIRRKSWQPFCFIHWNDKQNQFMHGDIQNYSTDGTSCMWSVLVSLDLHQNDWELFKIPSRQKLAAYEKKNKVSSGWYQKFDILPWYKEAAL